MSVAGASSFAPALAIAAAFSFCYAGMAGLCLAMDRHHAQVWRHDAPAGRRRLLRLAGSALIVLAIWPCVHLWGGSVGSVAWLGLLSAGALLVAGLLPYAPRAVGLLAAAAPLLALPLWSFGIYGTAP